MPDRNDRIRSLVTEFYARVRTHPELGPIFEERLSGRWSEHLDRMCSFWDTVLFGARSYRGDPMGAHARIPDLEPRHFSAWMELFAETAGDVLPADAADEIVGRADRMRRALERTVCGRSGAHGESPAPSSGPQSSPLPVTRP